MNYSTKYLNFTFLFYITTISLHSMDLVEYEKKPTIIGKIGISSEHGNSIYYASKNYHEHLCQLGIQSWIQMPLISVCVLVTNKNGSITNWVYDMPKLINEFEIKKFPPLIPAHYVHEAETGTILPFTIYGYPVQLRCVNSNQDLMGRQLENQSFQHSYKYLMDHFKDAPLCFNYDGDLERCRSQFVELEIIEPCSYDGQYRSGKNSFVSVEKLLCNRVQEKNKAGYLLLCLVHALPHLTKEAQDILCSSEYSY